MEFPSVEEAIAAGEEWLATHKTATIHYLKKAATEKDGYVEVSISELAEHVDAWNGLDSVDLDEMGFDLISLDSALVAIETVSDSAVSEKVKQLVEGGLIPSDEIFASVNEKKWIFFSERRACIVHHSTDWNGLSEYYGKYMNPTRH